MQIVELGAGCGLTGLSAAVALPEAHVVLTDYDLNVLRQLEVRFS